MKKFYFILFLILIGTGTFLLSVDGFFIKITGALLSIIGSYYLYQIQNKNSSSDKQEIISRIEDFKSELEQIKSTAKPEIQEQITEIENEFDRWAKDFKENRELKKIEMKSRDIDLEKLMWNLSNTYRPFYVEFVETIDKLVESYSRTNNIRIEITHNDSVPANLFLGQAATFRKVIKFPKKYFWIISFSIKEPIDEDEIPDIKVSVDTEGNFYPRHSSFIIYFKINEKKARVIKFDFFDRVQLENKEFLLEYFSETIRHILKTLFEYQLLNLD